MSLDSYFDKLENEEFIRGQNAIEGDGISTPPTENAVESYFAQIENLPTKKRSAKDIFQQSFDNLTNALSSTANGYLDVAGDVAGAINRGVVALPDTPAILQNLAVDLSGADDSFRARTIHQRHRTVPTEKVCPHPWHRGFPYHCSRIVGSPH